MVKFKLLLFLFITNIVFCQTTFTAKVVSIKDGDTVVVLDSLNEYFNSIAEYSNKNFYSRDFTFFLIDLNYYIPH